MDKDKLIDIVNQHKLWIGSDRGEGERADLRGANLREANLREAIGNMKEIRSLQIEEYPIVYTINRLQIGCENYSIKEWKNFLDEKILKMDGKRGLNWWKKWKEKIFELIEMSPARGDENGY